ncbi:MAG: hypothetical protein K6G37_01690 [Bacilli bacterium]|nr:hypothetical protein [Bacilli bacterium]
MAEKEKSSKGIVIKKERLFSLVFGIVSFLLLFVCWYKIDLMGVLTFPTTAFFENAGDAQTCLGIAKVIAIITMVVGILYILCQIVNMEKVVPGLKKFSFGFYRLAGLVYYGLFELALLFGIIGSIAADGVNPTVRIFILFVIFAAAIVKFAVPKIYNDIVKKIKITIE